MNKYIIKNCPAFKLGEPYPHKCFAYTRGICHTKNDCLLKQIVEKCQFHSKICKDCGSDVCFECEHLTGGNLANKILSMLEIQECE